MAPQVPSSRAAHAIFRRIRFQWPANVRHATASTSTTEATTPPKKSDLEELESTTFGKSKHIAAKSFDPLASARARKGKLPPGRYNFRTPKYYRGPLHPAQPPRPSDPASREFAPGPFSLPRLEQMYRSTIEPDLMTLFYQHFPPGTRPSVKPPRLRSWGEGSPYYKNRPLRGPRGRDGLSLLRKRITFQNVPKLEGVIVHSFVRAAIEDPTALHVATMALQAMTGVKPTTHPAKKNEVRWGLRAGKYVAVTAKLKGEDMYHFMSKLVDIVLPRIREWQGIAGSSGDDNGNISFGMTKEMVALFPEIEVNYDAYPASLIPGCNITIQTSATIDKDARLLLMAIGIPVHGKFID